MAWSIIGVSPTTSASGSDRYCRGIGGLPGHAIGRNGQPDQWTCFKQTVIAQPPPLIEELIVGRTVQEAGELIFWSQKSDQITKEELTVLEDKFEQWGEGVAQTIVTEQQGTSEERAIIYETTPEFIKAREDIDIMQRFEINPSYGSPLLKNVIPEVFVEKIQEKVETYEPGEFYNYDVPKITTTKTTTTIEPMIPQIQTSSKTGLLLILGVGLLGLMLIKK